MLRQSQRMKPFEKTVRQAPKSAFKGLTSCTSGQAYTGSWNPTVLGAMLVESSRRRQAQN